MEGGTIASIVLTVIVAIVFLGFAMVVLRFAIYKFVNQSVMEKIANPFDSTATNDWKFIMPIIFIVLSLIYFIAGFTYAQTHGQYRSTPGNIQKLLTIRKHKLSTKVHSLTINNSYTSVCKKILDKTSPYSQIASNATALVNWRPMTVRLAGYLNGDISTLDGVFDMKNGITLALEQGARAFVFDIDYLENSPCVPVVINRDNKGIMRSLHVGSIYEGCKTLYESAFISENYDPVIVIVFLRRIPSGAAQNTFLSNVAAGLQPLGPFHLGSNENGNFHNCANEDKLFTSPITAYQKKFIVLTNWDTTTIAPKQYQNPKDNLNFWTNARIWLDPSGIGPGLGVTMTAPDSPPSYAQIGNIKQLLNVGTPDQQMAYRTGGLTPSRSKFKIALGDINEALSVKELNTLLNVLGVQCVPINVLGAAYDDAHGQTIVKTPTTLQDLAINTNANDLLSFWGMGVGWSRKLLISDGSTEQTSITPIEGFIILTSVAPVAPPASSNSNGGSVVIR